MGALKIYLTPQSLRMLALGFSAGLPLLLVLGTLSFRLREAGISRATIGHLSWVGLAYGFKWLWAPLVDRFSIPLMGRMGRRRSWLLLAQMGVMTGLVGMALSNPQESLQTVVWCALLVAFSSATQDIALDAFRIESADVSKQAALAASYQTGYRLAMIWAGAGVLWIAARAQVSGSSQYDANAWRMAYAVMAGSMLVGVLTILFSQEPVQNKAIVRVKNIGEWVKIALISPFAEFISRHRWRAVLILALIATYRISDIVMGIMANPFYVDMGYTKDEVAFVSKIYGVVMTLLGAFIGGALTPKLGAGLKGVMRLMMLGAALSALANLLFVWLVSRGHNVNALIGVISADNLASGIASAAFIAYLSGLTSVEYTATQYALFSSLMLLLPKFLAGFSGEFVDAHGYAMFFTCTSLMSIPVLGLVWWVGRSERF